MKIDKAIQEYLAWKGTYAPRAANNYRKWIQYFLEVNGDKHLCKYDVAHLVRFRNWLSDNYSPCSIQFGMIVIHNFFKYWRLKGEPCLSPELIKISRAFPRSHRAVTEAEFIKLIGAIDEHSFNALRDKLIFSMLWDTGVRVSELCDLNVEQISRQKRTAVISTKKNGQKRIIMWSKSTHELIYHYLPLRALLTNASPLFVSNASGRITRLTARSIERHVRYYAQKAGIQDKVTPHSFRHGWAHHRLNQRASLPFIQRGLGHTSPLSTHVYLQYNDQEFETQAQGYL